MNPNPGYLCPLTGIVMRDPVVLESTLISFERIAILWWLSVNPDICPVTGRPVTECALRNDDELREAIQEWAARCSPHLLVRAVLCCALLRMHMPLSFILWLQEPSAVQLDTEL